MRKWYKVGALLLKPILGLCGLVGRRRVLLQYPGSATVPFAEQRSGSKSRTGSISADRVRYYTDQVK